MVASISTLLINLHYATYNISDAKMIALHIIETAVLINTPYSSVHNQSRTQSNRYVYTKKNKTGITLRDKQK